MSNRNQIIEEEILLNGNTNLISDSGLKSGSQIFAIGDSHSIFFYNSMLIKEHWASENLPVTINKFLKIEFDIHHIGDILGNGHERYNIKSEDFVIFYYGYNDIQRNVYVHCQNDYASMLDEILLRYIQKIKLIESERNINPIVSCIYPIPRVGAVGVDIKGSDEVRIEYTKYANSKLLRLCEQFDIRYLNLYDKLVDTKGYIREEITNDLIHLDYNNEELRIIVEDYILKLCK